MKDKSGYVRTITSRTYEWSHLNYHLYNVNFSFAKCRLSLSVHVNYHILIIVRYAL